MNAKDTIKKKLIFIHQSNIAEWQTIFEKEAEKGWIYCGNKGYLYFFRKAQAKKMKFRLLPYLDKLSDTEIERYAQDGWDFVDNMDRTAIFCGKKSVNEIKIQPKKTENIVDRLKNEIIFQGFFVFGIVVLAIISWIAVTFSKGYFWKNIVDNWNANFSIPTVFITLIFITCLLLVDKVRYLKAFNNMPIKSGGEITNKKVCLIVSRVVLLLLIIISILGFGMTVNSMLNGINSRDCLKYKGHNIVGVMDVEEQNEFYTKQQYDNLGIKRNVNVTPAYVGKYSISKTLMCNEHLKWNEKLYNDANNYSAQLIGEYYDLKNKEIAKRIYREVVKKVEKNDKKEGIVGTIISEKKTKKYKFDEKYVVCYASACTVVIRKRNIIYYIEFTGKKNYENVLDNIVNTFEGRKIFGYKKNAFAFFLYPTTIKVYNLTS